MLGLHLDGELDRKTFMEKKREIEKEIKKKEELLARHKRGDKAFEKNVADLVRVFTEVPKAYSKAAGSAKNIRIELREPYALFVGPAIEEAAALPTKKAVQAPEKSLPKYVNLEATSWVIWRRRELNPRPTVRTAGHYMLSRRLMSNASPADRNSATV